MVDIPAAAAESDDRQLSRRSPPGGGATEDCGESVPVPPPSQTMSDCGVCLDTVGREGNIVPLPACHHRLHLQCLARVRVRASIDVVCACCRAAVGLQEVDAVAVARHGQAASDRTFAEAGRDLEEVIAVGVEQRRAQRLAQARGQGLGPRGIPEGVVLCAGDCGEVVQADEGLIMDNCGCRLHVRCFVSWMEDITHVGQTYMRCRHHRRDWPLQHALPLLQRALLTVSEGPTASQPLVARISRVLEILGAVPRRRGVPGFLTNRANVPALAYPSLDHLVRTRGRDATSSFFLCPLFGDAMNMPEDTFASFPRTDAWRTVVAAYRQVFTAVGATPAQYVFRLPNGRSYISAQHQEELLALSIPWQNELSQWAYDVRVALLSSRAPPLFPAVARLIDGGISTGSGVGAVGTEVIDVGTGVQMDAGEGGGSGENEARDRGEERGRGEAGEGGGSGGNEAGDLGGERGRGEASEGGSGGNETEDLGEERGRAKQAKVERVEGVEGVEGMKRVIWIERGDGAGARNKNLDNYGPAAKERNQPQATGPRVTAHAATPLPVEAGEGDPEGGGMLGEGAGEEWQWLTVADVVGEEWRVDEVEDSGERAQLSLGRAVVGVDETYSRASAR